MAEAEYEFYVDWDNDGNWAGAYHDITDDVLLPASGLSMPWHRGKDQQFGNATTGMLETPLINADGKYSPENTTGPLYGKVKPYRPIGLRAYFDGVWYDLYYGYISKIVPHPHLEKRDLYMYCIDGMDWLTRAIVNFNIEYSEY